MKPLRKVIFCLLAVALMLPQVVWANNRTVTQEQVDAQRLHYELWQQNQERPMRVVRITRLFVVQPDFDDFARLERYFENYVSALALLGARVEVVDTIIADNSVVQHDVSLHFSGGGRGDSARELARIFRNVDKDGRSFDLIADRNNGIIDGLALFTDSVYAGARPGLPSGIAGAEAMEMGTPYLFYQGVPFGAFATPAYEGLDLLLPIVLLDRIQLHGIDAFLEGMASMYGRSYLDMYTYFGRDLGDNNNCPDMMRLIPNFEYLRLRYQVMGPANRSIYTNPNNPEFWHNPNHPVFSITGGREDNQERREMARWNMARAFGQPGFNEQGFPTDPVVWLFGVVPFESYIEGFVEVDGRYYHPDEYDYKYRWLPAVMRGELDIVPYFETTEAFRAEASRQRVVNWASRANIGLVSSNWDESFTSVFLNETISRGGAISVLDRAFTNSRLPTATIPVPFTDVSGAWFNAPASAGVFGNASGQFRPSAPLTVAYAQEFLANTARFLGVAPLPASRFHGNASGQMSNLQFYTVVFELFSSAGYFR